LYPIIATWIPRSGRTLFAINSGRYPLKPGKSKLKVLVYLIEIAGWAALCRGIPAQIPVGRTTSPSEIAALVLWLVEGEGAQLMTGETVVSRGGMLMRDDLMCRVDMDYDVTLCLPQIESGRIDGTNLKNWASNDAVQLSRRACEWRVLVHG
jgi:hypothetical protein